MATIVPCPPNDAGDDRPDRIDLSLAVTGLCQALFRDKANGSLITVNDQVVGSALIGQNFTKPRVFSAAPLGGRQ